MSLRNHVTLALLITGLASALLVAGLTRHIVIGQGLAKQQAFTRFIEEVETYIKVYGSYEQARNIEPFANFSRRNLGRDPSTLIALHEPFASSIYPQPTPTENKPSNKQPYSGFTLLSSKGVILQTPNGREEGQVASEAWLRQAKPIRVDGNIVALALPEGNDYFDEIDHAYIRALQVALLYGLGGALLLALGLGLLFGYRLSLPLQRLTIAARAIAAGDLHQRLSVYDTGEMGQLGSTFNQMSLNLSKAYGELEQRVEELQNAHKMLEEQAEKLKEMSTRDELTQLYNRRYFNEHVTQALANAKRYGSALSVMIGDVDNFKKINDTFSHAIGDEVLRRIGQLLESHTRSGDIVARYGGEEFVIAFPEALLESAYIACEKIRLAIESHPWDEIHPDLRVTMSMGLAADLSVIEYEQLLGLADEALYEAKRSGKNQICSYVAAELPF